LDKLSKITTPQKGEQSKFDQLDQHHAQFCDIVRKHGIGIIESKLLLTYPYKTIGCPQINMIWYACMYVCKGEEVLHLVLLFQATDELTSLQFYFYIHVFFSIK